MRRIVGCAVVLGTASLVACSESSGPTGPDNTITVQGRVVDEYLQPLPSTYVLIAGHETVTTDANGYFSVTKVSVPYDLILQIPDVGTRDLLIYHGLIRSDPLIVTPPMPFSTSFRSAYIWGSTYGGGPLPDPPDRKSSLLFDSPETQFVGSAGSGSYSMQPQWLGPDSTDGLLHALQWQFDPASRHNPCTKSAGPMRDRTAIAARVTARRYYRDQATAAACCRNRIQPILRTVSPASRTGASFCDPVGPVVGLRRRSTPICTQSGRTLRTGLVE